MNQKLKIAYFLGQFPRLTTTFVHNEINMVKNAGHEVFVFVMDDPLLSDMEKTNDWQGLNIFYIKRHFSWVKALGAHFFYLLTQPFVYCALLKEVLTRQLSVKVFLKFLWVVGEVKKHNLDLIHGHFIEEQTILAKIVSRFLRIAFTFKIHGSDIFLAQNNSYKLMIRDARCCFIVDRSIEEYLINKCGVNYGNLMLNPCGIDLDQFNRDSFEGINAQKVLCVARQFKEKGIQDLIEAMKLLKAENFPCALTIVGDGPDIGLFKNLVKEYQLMDCVAFTLALGKNEVRKHYMDAAVKILPSYCEGLPMVLLEACACSLPVIATNVGGIPQIVKNDVNGCLIEPGDPRVLAEKIKYVLSDMNRARRFGEKGRVIAEKYSLSFLTAAMIEKWEEIIAEKDHND